MKPACYSLSMLFIVMSLGGVAWSEGTGISDLHGVDFIDSELTILNLSDIEELSIQTDSLIDNGRCEEALPSIIKIQESSNVASNILSRGLAPFSRASRDEQRLFITITEDMKQAERLAMDMRQTRNRYIVLEAECLIELGESFSALNRLYHALSLITYRERELWEHARALLWDNIGFSHD